MFSKLKASTIALAVFAPGTLNFTTSAKAQPYGPGQGGFGNMMGEGWGMGWGMWDSDGLACLQSACLS